MAITTSDLKQPAWSVYCNRNIIFKKYTREISEIVRLDINIDILPKKEGASYDEKKIDKTYYIDMSDSDFVIYNEDLKKCGNYDYNNEKLIIYKLPLKSKTPIINKETERTRLAVNSNYDEDTAIKIAMNQSLACFNAESRGIPMFPLDLQEQKKDKYNEINKRESKIKSNQNNNSLSGIKAEERLEIQNKKFKYIKKNSRRPPNKEFTNIALLKDLT